MISALNMVREFPPVGVQAEIGLPLSTGKYKCYGSRRIVSLRANEQNAGG